MSYENGMKALNLEMGDVVPRTEYSAEFHWDLVKKVTGIDTDVHENRHRASQEFVQAWDYAFKWFVDIGRYEISKKGGRITHLGHAEYSEDESGKSDFQDNATQPFTNPEEVYALDFFKEYGEWTVEETTALHDERYHEQLEKWPGTVNMSGIYVSLFSGLIEILGWDTLLMSIAVDEERFGKFIDQYVEWVTPFFKGLAECESPVIMSHDDLVWTSGPVTHPEWYRTYIFPHLRKLWKIVKDGGKRLIFTCDGNYTAFIDDLLSDAECAPHSVVMEPDTDMAQIAEKYGNRVGFVGNADCRVLLSGSKDDIYKEVERCMNIGKKYPGFIMAVGNHIPPNTPVDNALYYNEAYMKMRNR